MCEETCVCVCVCVCNWPFPCVCVGGVFSTNVDHLTALLMGPVPYFSHRDPVLVCWHSLFISSLQLTHVVSPQRRGRRNYIRQKRKDKKDKLYFQMSRFAFFILGENSECLKTILSLNFLCTSEILDLPCFIPVCPVSAEQLPGQRHVYSQGSAESKRWTTDLESEVRPRLCRACCFLLHQKFRRQTPKINSWQINLDLTPSRGKKPIPADVGTAGVLQ